MKKLRMQGSMRAGQVHTTTIIRYQVGIIVILFLKFKHQVGKFRQPTKAFEIIKELKKGTEIFQQLKQLSQLRKRMLMQIGLLGIMLLVS